jgi:hypothetical protein
LELHVGFFRHPAFSGVLLAGAIATLATIVATAGTTKGLTVREQ